MNTRQATEKLPAERRPRNRSQTQIEESAQLKASIVDAAAAVFARNGYRATTLQDVAEVVGLSRPGLLHHFLSKEALFVAVLERAKAWAQEAWRASTVADDSGLGPIVAFVGGDESARWLFQLVHVLEGEAISGNEHAQAYVLERARFIRQRIADRLRSQQAEGKIRADVDIEVIATLVASTVNGLQKSWLIDVEVDPRPPFRALVAALTASLGPVGD
jgi:AcrR family transcriptional regulator